MVMCLLSCVPLLPNASTYEESSRIIDMLSTYPCEGTSLALVYVKVFQAFLPHRFILIAYGRLSVAMERKSAILMAMTAYGPMG